MKFEVFSLSLTKQEITLHFLKRKNLSHSPALYILQYKKSIFFTNAQKPQMRWVSLGFLFGVLSLVWVESCVTFQRFGSIRSTQPTGLLERNECFNFCGVLLKIAIGEGFEGV